MRTLLFILAVCFLGKTNANAIQTRYNHNETPIVFIENGVEYAIFKNGEFDFNVLQPRSSRVRINTPRTNISFNTGYNYNPCISRNNFGDVIAINNTRIFYDRRGRVEQIGTIDIYYNRRGYVNSVGRLNVNYNTYDNSYRYTGYVNRANFGYNPVCTTYRRPIRHHHNYITHRRAYRQNAPVNSRNYNRKDYNKRNSNGKYSYNSRKTKKRTYRNIYDSPNTKNYSNRKNTPKKRQKESNFNRKRENTTQRNNSKNGAYAYNQNTKKYSNYRR